VATGIGLQAFWLEYSDLDSSPVWM
jgi:hypothetical protein